MPAFLLKVRKYLLENLNLSTRKTLQKKPFDQLTITDNYVFQIVMKNPERVRPLLEMVLEKKIKKIVFIETEKTKDTGYKSRGIRCDVYIEDDKDTVYNVEIQTTKNKNLPKRIRYYQGMIDLDIIDKGDDYSSLKKSFIIFICTYDPYKTGRYIYTFKTQCQEDSSIYLKDDTTKIIVNANGTVGDISDDLRDTLSYMTGKAPVTDYAKDLDKAVDEIKNSEEWRREYMTLLMRDKENIKIGEYVDKIAAIREARNDVDRSILMRMFRLDDSEFDKVILFIDERPDWDNEDIAEAIIRQGFCILSSMTK
jgi:predicted transposase/invertase (TIGR01784 family)